MTTDEMPTIRPEEGGVSRRARREEEADTKRFGILPTILMLVAVFSITFGARLFVLQIATVEGVSMEGTLTDGERVLVLMCDYWFDTPLRGDVVMCSYPGREGTYIKRVLALPGEMVMIRDSTVYVDGRPLAERYVVNEAEEDFGPTRVPNDSYFVIGDNRPVSGDSRLASVGSLPISRIQGRAVAIVAPFDQFAELERR